MLEYEEQQTKYSIIVIICVCEKERGSWTEGEDVIWKRDMMRERQRVKEGGYKG